MQQRSAPEIITIGETMALVTPMIAEPLDTAELFRLESGGAESNVAVHLAALGHRAAWAGQLGDDALGHRVERQLRERNVDTSLVRFDPNAPTGVYFKNPGMGVHYYRANSAAAGMTPTVLNRIPLEQAALVHVSGITPALSGTCAELIDAVVDRVRRCGALLSFDVNYRAGLWSVAEAASVLAALARQADIVFVGLDEAQTLWGAQTAADVRALLPEPAHLVVKDGPIGASEFSEHGMTFVPAHTTTVVEAVGAGDAFAAGYLSGYLTGLSSEHRLAGGHDRALLVLHSTTDLPQPVN